MSYETEGYCTVKINPRAHAKLKTMAEKEGMKLFVLASSLIEDAIRAIKDEEKKCKKGE